MLAGRPAQRVRALEEELARRETVKAQRQAEARERERLKKAAALRARSGGKGSQAAEEATEAEPAREEARLAEDVRPTPATHTTLTQLQKRELFASQLWCQNQCSVHSITRCNIVLDLHFLNTEQLQ